MELRHLKQFLAVAEHRNFVRAADALDMTQQALSYSIAQLERSLGVKLFERGQFGAEPTDIGQAFARRARLVCAELELVRSEVEAMRDGASGQARVGMSRVIADRLFPEVIARFQRARPTVAVWAHVDHSQRLFQLLLEGELDFVVSTPVDPEFGAAELRHEPLGRHLVFDANLVVMRHGHPLQRRGEVTLADLRTHPWILPTRFTGFFHRITEHFLAHGVAAPDYILRTESISLAKTVVQRTDFLAALGRESVADELERHVIHGVPIPGLEARLPAYFSVRRRFPLASPASALLDVFLDLARRRPSL
jgi:DNA-binding transcriptional LysR family regulator